jgi:hypothetical protein
MQDGVHLFGDWHFYTAALCQAYCSVSRENAFGYFAVHARNNVVQLAPAS